MEILRIERDRFSIHSSSYIVEKPWLTRALPRIQSGAHNDPKPPVVLSDAHGVRNNARALLSYVMFAVVGKNPRSAPDHSVTKTLSYRTKDPEKPRMMRLAPTGVAAINIEGTTIHSALGIPVGRYGNTIPKLSDKMRSSLRNKLSALQVLIVDEISKISNKLLLYIHQRLVEIFGCSADLPFAGLTVMFCGDFYQLPPIKAKTIYAPYENWLLA